MFDVDPKVVLQYSGGTGFVHPTKLQCFGNETSLLECTYEEVEYDYPGCEFGEDLGVSCGKSYTRS